MMANRITINRQGVDALLTSPGVRTALEQAANQIAAKVRAANSLVYPSYDVSVQSSPRGGIRNDRAVAHVVVAPPPPDAVRYPDRDRFDTLARIAGEVSR